MPNLVKRLKDNTPKVAAEIKKGSTWGLHGSLAFDAVVGNPPYQVEVAKKQSETNGQARRSSIFQFFQLVADAVSCSYTSLIYPGARWIHRSGKGMKEFGLKQINDPRLSKILFWPDSEEVFPGIVSIADGISIVMKDMHKANSGFHYIYRKGEMMQECDSETPGEEFLPLKPSDRPILAKTRAFCSAHNLDRLNAKIYSQKFFGVESDFVANNPDIVRPYDEAAGADWSKEVKLLANDKAGKAGRSTWYVIKRSAIKENNAAIDLWKVVVSSANAGGQKRDWQLELLDNHSAFGRSRVALGMFKTKSEAENFMKFCQSDIIRFLFLMTDEALTTLAKEVPYFSDWKTADGLLDFNDDVNKQLCTLFKLTKPESAYVTKTIRAMDTARHRTSPSNS